VAALRIVVLVLVVLLGIAGVVLQPQLHDSGPDVQVITQALFVADGSGEPPGPGAAWELRTLPDHWRRPAEGGDSGWYRAMVGLAEAPEVPWAVFIPRASTSYELYVNGVPVGASARKAWSVSMPQMDLVAPQLLHAGDNVLELRLTVLPDRRGGLTAITLGPQAQVEHVFNRDHFARFTLTRSLNTALLVIGLLTLMLWLARPVESIYGWFAAVAIVWSLRNFQYVLPIDTALFAHFERVLLASLIVVVILLWLFTRRFTGRPHDRVERGLLLGGGAGVLVLFVASTPVVHAARLPVGLACASVGIWIIAMMVRFGLQPGNRRWGGVWVIVAAQVVALLLALSDLAVAARLLPFGPASRNAYGAPLILFAMVYALAEHYFRTYDALRLLSAGLERRVAERTAELERSHARVLALERAATLAGERDRMMRDMHDGIGSQLITTLDAVERGSLRPAEVGALLRGCLDDLRLMIDSLDPHEDSLASALANLRWRLEPRLSAAGIKVRWEVDDGLPAMSPGAVLQVLRVVQEAITNVLKHARATGLRIAAQGLPDGGLRLEVEDDGQGCALAPVGTAGRGLGNMRTRARQLGGSLDVAPGSDGRGTCVRLEVPVPARTG
jgi:signal transduction histidine kinase